MAVFVFEDAEFAVSAFVDQGEGCWVADGGFGRLALLSIGGAIASSLLLLAILVFASH